MTCMHTTIKHTTNAHNAIQLHLVR